VTALRAVHLAPSPGDPPHPEAVLGYDGLAGTLGVSRRTVERWRQAGCPTVPMGPTRAIRFRVRDVMAWLERAGEQAA